MSLFINILAFQICWFACVLGAANAAPLVGPIVVVAVIALHLTRSNQPARELALVVAAGLLGAVWDSALVIAEWISYPSGNLFAGVAPYWIVAMWMSFATTLNVSLRWLRHRFLLAVILGGIGGPSAYLAGSGLGGVTIVNPVAGFIALALGWAVMLPLLGLLATRFDGVAAPNEAERACV